MNVKMIAGITLIVGIASIALLAAPIQAYLNGTANGDMLQTQDRDRLRTQNRDRQRTNECATNRTCNCTIGMEQFRNQHRERTRSQGN